MAKSRPIALEFQALMPHIYSMTVITTGTSEKEVREEVAAIKAASAKVLSSKTSAHEYLRKHGYITKHGKLTKRYGG